MKTARMEGVRLRTALSWCLALMLCAQMLGTGAVRAFADEAKDVTAAASESLGKNLVYDDVYGVSPGGIAMMVKEGLIADGSGDTYQGIRQANLLNSSGTVLASFGMEDAPSSCVTEADKASCLSGITTRMEQLLRENFPFLAVPKNVDDKVKYGFVSNDGTEIAPCRYDNYVKTPNGKPVVAALDCDGSVVDIYAGDGAKTASVPMPTDWSKGWSEEGPKVTISFASGEKTSLTLRLSGRTADGEYVLKDYAWDAVGNSFVAKGKDEGGGTDGSTVHEWDLPDGGKVTIAKVDGRDEFTCTTPKGSFTISEAASLWDFKVVVEVGLNQYSVFGNAARIWDLSGTEVTGFEGAAIEITIGENRVLCRQFSKEGTKYSIRNTDGTIVKFLPEADYYRFEDPFLCVTDSEGTLVLFDSSGNEAKRLSPATQGNRISFYRSAVKEVLVATEASRGDYSGIAIALAAYDKMTGSWSYGEKATGYARAVRSSLADGAMAYMLPVYDHDDGMVNARKSPAYYQHVDRNLNALSYGYYNGRTPSSNWASFQQAQRVLDDGTVMSYAADASGKYGAVDEAGNVLIPFEYDAYYDCGDHDSLILLKKASGWEFFDTSTVDTGKEPVPATSVTISGAPEQLPVGATAQLTATVQPENSTDKVAWTSSNTSVLTVDAAGLVKAVANGEATVTATAGGVSNAVTITVTTPVESVTIAGTPEKPLNVGGTVQLSAQVKPEGATNKVAWASSDENVLTVDADGLVTALGNGEAAITATAGAQSDSVTIAVVTPASGIELDAAALALYRGDKPSKLQATVLPATASNKGVAWTSSNNDVATVSEDGAVTPVGLGTATVTAKALDGGFAATCTVTVGEHVTGVELDKSKVAIVGAGTAQLKATVFPDEALDKSVTWSTSDESVATVDGNGLVTAAGKGSATVTATTLDGKLSATCAVEVSNPVTGFDLSAASVALKKGEAQTVRVAAHGDLPGEVDGYEVSLSVEGEGSYLNGIWSDASGKAVFGIEDKASEDGVGRDCAITALGTGKGTLVFETKQGSSIVRGVVAVAVTNPAQAVTLNAASKQFAVGDEPFTLTATVNPADADEAGSIVWSTSNAAVASVEGGVVTPVGVGSATITAKAGAVSATCAVAVSAKQIAKTEDGSAYQASVEATDSAVAKRLEQIAQDNGGTLSLAVQGAGELTEAARQAIASLQGSQRNVADILDVSFHDGAGEEVSVNLGDDGLMTVRVRMTDALRALDPMTLKVSHVADEGAIEEKRTWVDGDDLCFATEHFSTYVVTGSERQVPDGGSNGSGTVVPGGGGNGGGAGQGGSAGPSLAPTGDTLALPLTLAGCAVAAALACLACLRGRRLRMK